MNQRKQTNPDTPKAQILRFAEAEQVWLSSDVYTLTVPGEATGGAISLTDAWVPPGGGPPPHIHVDALEIITVLDGSVTLYLYEEGQEVHTGDVAVIPAGTVHRFYNHTATPAHLQFLFTPSGTEQFFKEAGTKAEPALPIPVATEADNLRAAEVGLRHGLQPA
ncbi:quercetin dioxygenase-like cupin family protein [Arthrobacter sp. JUb119]|uniref:cupin domain-containing protein n=1 Tax=Arthrobacter sp. JUb115 TaxID=2485108 RepID=UPI0010604DB8|nr:cupin domain-containing protein [Arthrobacter sp. JUb115]MCS3494495.1 quercetin dioxygenase-like cupin family protein [Arthrobacter sp. JUb119]TDU22585.1 cupin domain [Arthrobacter sp. JUb115]